MQTSHLVGDCATRSLARLKGHLTLSLLLAGSALRRRRFASDTLLDALSSVSNYGF